MAKKTAVRKSRSASPVTSASRDNNVALQALAARLLIAQDEERSRVSRELHDQICQQLASLAIDLSSFSADPRLSARQRASRLAIMQQRVILASDATRRIACQLCSPVLEDLGPVAAIRALCRDFFDQEGVRAHFHHSGASLTVSAQIANCLYRIAQESMRSIVGRSGATMIHVSLETGKRSVVLSIAHDGSGFGADGDGAGRAALEERARLVSGEVSFWARPGEGSKVRLQIPLTEAVL